MKTTLKHKVEKILELFEDARNNDAVLYAHLIYYYYNKYITTNASGDFCIRLKDLKHLPKQYDVQRYRQIIQNKEEKFLPTNEEVKKLRFNRQIEIRKEFGYNPELVEPIA